MQTSYNVGEMVLDLALRHPQSLGQLSRREPSAGQQVHKTLTWCLFEGIHGDILYETATEREPISMYLPC